MDVLAIYSVFGGAGIVLTTGIAMGRQMTIRRDITSLDSRVHKIAGRIDGLDATYARKDTIAERFTAIEQSLERIERHQEAMAQRFMSGGAGA